MGDAIQRNERRSLVAAAARNRRREAKNQALEIEARCIYPPWPEFKVGWSAGWVGGWVATEERAEGVRRGFFQTGVALEERYAGVLLKGGHLACVGSRSERNRKECRGANTQEAIKNFWRKHPMERQIAEGYKRIWLEPQRGRKQKQLRWRRRPCWQPW